MSVSSDNGLSSRQVALEVLIDVLIKKQPLDLVLETHNGFKNLNSKDRNFTRMMVATILRRKGQIDALILRGVDQDKPLHPESLMLVLYIGIVQIIFMDVSDHAAVHVTVELAKSNGFSRQKGLINAVLRRITTEGREWIKNQDSVQSNIPEWLLSNWIEGYGLKKAAQIAESSLTEASLDISVKDEAMKLNWAKALDATILPTGSLRRVSGGNITHLQGFDEGAWWVQDASAALPVKLLSDAFGGDINGKTFIDLCSAPGGKTAQLAAKGANVTAVDRAAKRLNKLIKNMERLGLTENVQTVISDGAQWQPIEPADAVLIDAPCSATGTIRRHPDVMHSKMPIDMERLCVIQSKIFENAARMISKGGILIYCTCSLQKQESEAQVAAFLQNHPEFDRLPINNDEVGGLGELINEAGEVRILPYHLAPHGGMDGFFISRLIKRS